MRGPQNICRTLPQPKISPLGPQKVKNYPKIKQKQISEFTETYIMRIVQLYEQTPKQFLNPTPNPKNSPRGPPKVKNNPKIKSKSKVTFEVTLGVQKVKNNPKIKSKSNVIIEGSIEDESCSTASVDPKTVVEHNLNRKNSPTGPQKGKKGPKQG